MCGDCVQVVCDLKREESAVHLNEIIKKKKDVRLIGTHARSRASHGQIKF